MSNTLAVNIITTALQILDSSDKWTKHYSARDKDGKATHCDSPDAVCWCLRGALYRAATKHHITRSSDSTLDVLDAVRHTIKAQDPTLNYVEYNDHPNTTYENIINLLYRARQRALERKIKDKQIAISVIDTTLNILNAPEKWTQGEYARDKDGDPIDHHDPQATCWCLDGAFHKAMRINQCDYGSSPAVLTRHALRHSLNNPERTYVEYNDHPNTTYNGIIALLNRAKQYIKDRKK